MKRLLLIIPLLLCLSLYGQTQYYSIINAKKTTPYVQEPFPDVTGMTLAAVGNSITQCCTQCTFTYPTVLGDSMNLGTITNKGISGNTMARIVGVRDGFRAQVIQSYGNDIISIFGGTNDWAFDVPLGTTSDYNDTNNVSGAANYFLDLIEANSPSSIIFFIIPLTRNRDKTGVEQETEPTNALGLTVQAYGNAIKAVCEARNIRYLDAYEINGLLFSDIDTWAGDGLHPNNTGQMRLGRIIKYYMLNSNYKNLY